MNYCFLCDESPKNDDDFNYYEEFDCYLCNFCYYYHNYYNTH